MHRLVALAGLTSLIGLGTFAQFSSSADQPRRTAQVMVHCPNGNNEGFVTPARVRIALGDSVLWRMTGQVVSDSIVIYPKDSAQRWPFAGTPSRGGTSARANGATTRGTYGYNVRLLCRIPGRGVQTVVIDPDIIIE